jgi:hypothetical protein
LPHLLLAGEDQSVRSSRGRHALIDLLTLLVERGDTSSRPSPGIGHMKKLTDALRSEITRLARKGLRRTERLRSGRPPKMNRMR